MAELQRLRIDHAAAVLAFETADRAWFAESVSDRGDDYFTHFEARHHDLVAAQDKGEGAFHVLVADDGSMLGRFNLEFRDDGTAEVGYRVARDVAGRGVGTAGVRELCRLAAAEYGLRKLRAATSTTNVASSKVLLKNGFVAVRAADPADVGGKSGTWYERDLD